MKTSKYRLYEKDERCWREYDKESYEAIKRWRMNFCAKQRYNKACFCPKREQWKCNTICMSCPYRKFETPFGQPIKGTKNLTLEERLFEETNLEMQCIESVDAERILSRIKELMPQAQEIGRLRLQGKSETEISAVLGIPRATIYTRLKALEKKLLDEFGEF